MIRLVRSLNLKNSVQYQRLFSTTQYCHAGHNKWSKIKDKKGASDNQKSILYSKANHEIITAARVGGSNDPNKNSQLATALKKAKDNGVPKENIEKALLRASGSKSSGNRLVYEALVFDSVGLIIECHSENANRTLHNVRAILTSRGARMAPVNFMFVRRGRITIAISNTAQPDFVNQVMDHAIDNLAEDVRFLEDVEAEEGRLLEFVCDPANLAQLEESLTKQDGNIDGSLLTIVSSELAYLPLEETSVEGETADQLEDLIRELNENSDTSRVWTSTNLQSQV